MTTSGSNLSCQVRPQTFSRENCPGLARRRGRLRGAEWSNSNISQHIQNNVNGVSFAAYFRSVQAQAQRYTSRMRYVTVVDAWGACVPRERCLGLRYRGMRRNTNSCTGREIEPLMDQLVATCTPHLLRTTGLESPLCRTGSHILPSLGI